MNNPIEKMSLQNQFGKQQPQPLTPEIVRSKLQIALTKVEKTIQNFHDREAMLVYNEDCLKEVKEFIEDIKEAKRLVDTERKRLKEPSLQESRNVDAGAKLVDSQLDEVLAKANQPYQKLCQEVEKRRQAAEAEKQRVAGIKKAIDDFFIEQSTSVAAASNPEEIVRIEKLVGSHKANKSRYAEFLPLMAEKAALLADLIKTKKIALRELEALKTAENASDDDQTILDLREKQEQVEATIHQAQIDVQEASLKMATQSTETVDVIVPVIPKGGRRLWKYEIVDEKAANKAGLMKLVPDTEKIDARLKEIRESETETTENGIRYYIEKKW